MFSVYIIILLGYVNVALSLDYDDFINNYRAIARGTDAPEGSYMHVGRMWFNMEHDGTEKSNGGTGFFIMHQGANLVEKLFFVTAAHIFDMDDIPTDQYVKPGRTPNISLISKGTIEIFYGSVKIEDQKVLQVYPNGLYTPAKPGEAHIARLQSSYPFAPSFNPNFDIAVIELTKHQTKQFVADGGMFVKTKDDIKYKGHVFPSGEVCTIGAWGYTNEKEDDPAVLATILQQIKDKDYCIEDLGDNDPFKPILQSIQNFACFSTHFSSDNDPDIKGGDSGAPITCGNGDGLVATIVSVSGDFVGFGPTRQSILAFVKDCFYD